eukprot:1964864-Ditylum_brightwellii.AAC.1
MSCSLSWQGIGVQESLDFSLVVALQSAKSSNVRCLVLSPLFLFLFVALGLALDKIAVLSSC